MRDIESINEFASRAVLLTEGRVLPARNTSYGFYGTILREVGRRGVAAEWEAMSRHAASRRDAIRAKLKGRDVGPSAVRDFLDSKNGRWLAEEYNDRVTTPEQAWSAFSGDKELLAFMSDYDPKDHVGESAAD